MNFKIKTERLILMPPTLADVQRIAELVGDKDVSWKLARVPYPYSVADAENWVSRSAASRESGSEYAFGVYLAGDGLIGSCGLSRQGEHWELGYWYGKPYWEQGFATEAGDAVLEWARREIPADAFISGHIRDNVASGHVLRKLGFTPIGEISVFTQARGAEVPTLRYALNAPDNAALAPIDFRGSHD